MSVCVGGKGGGGRGGGESYARWYVYGHRGVVQAAIDREPGGLAPWLEFRAQRLAVGGGLPYRVDKS